MKLSDIRNEYNNITAPEKLKLQVSEKFRRRLNMKKTISICASVAAAVVLVFALTLNFVPSIAYAMSDVPVIGSIVRVVTFDRFEMHDDGYEADIVTPRIEGLKDKQLENKINEALAKDAQEMIEQYKKDVKTLKEEFGEETVHMGITSDYEIKTDNDDILALDVYVLTTSGSSSTMHTFYTIDKNTGELLTLEGLFKKNADYITPISDYIKQEMRRLNKEESGMFWIDTDNEFTEDFDKIKPDQNFYINDNGNLVIAFDKYEVAAGAQGSPEFVIPNSVISDIIK